MIRFDSQPFAGRRWSHARRPNYGFARYALAAGDDTLFVNLIYPLPQAHFHTELL